MILPILAVKDVDASVAFYTEKLGFEHVTSMQGTDGKNNFAFVKLGADQIGLSTDALTYERGKGVVLMIYPPEAIDIDTYYAEIEGRGVTIVEPLKTEYWGDRLFSVHDLDGFYLTICRTVRTMAMDEIADVHAKQGEIA